MPDSSVENILHRLQSREPRDAWTEFLDEYSGLIFQIARHFETDLERSSDCFQFVCEKLSEDRFRRLRRFNTAGPARFSTWLRAVVRNLCLDWRRKEFGRRRRFRSIARLSMFDQDVFCCDYERRVSTDEALHLLQSKFSDLTQERVSESRERIEKALTAKQHWLLNIQFARQAPARDQSLERVDQTPLEIPDHRPNPEAQSLMAERSDALERALNRLSERDRLLVRLRFEQELTLHQIANLLKLGNAQRADRKIKEILAQLREELH